MMNIVLVGVGGQGIILGAKVLAVAAASRGYSVRTSEAPDVTKRGESVSMHVRIADEGEEIFTPIVPRGMADLIISFEPGEAARALPLLASDGAIITATTPVVPVTAAYDVKSYDVEEIIKGIQLALYNRRVRNISHALGHVDQVKLIQVNDLAVTDMLGENRKVLNAVMLAAATKAGCLSVTAEELCHAVEACVKPDYAKMNIQAIKLVMGA